MISRRDLVRVCDIRRGRKVAQHRYINVVYVFFSSSLKIRRTVRIQSQSYSTMILNEIRTSFLRYVSLVYVKSVNLLSLGRIIS